MHSKEPNVHSKEPYVHSKEPYVHSKEPNVHSKEPYVHSKEPYVPLHEKDESFSFSEYVYTHICTQHRLTRALYTLMKA